MKHRWVSAWGAVALLVVAGQVRAQTQTASAASPADDPKLGSVHVRCDGLPPHMSGPEIAARLVLIMGTAGLAGASEIGDVKKRLTDADGVAACTAALEHEHDPIRRVQLTLARSIHHIEAKEYEAALTDARAAPGLAGDKAQELGFRHSLLLSSLELEAAALVRLNRPAEAADAALRMAAASPYDVTAQTRAAPYVILTSELSPAKRDYLDRYPRLWPAGLLVRANANEWNGDYLSSAADTEAFMDLAKAFGTDKDPMPPQPALAAHRAMALALAGEMEKSNAAAAETRELLDQLIKSGKALTMQTVVNEGQEFLDFQAIASELAAGKAAQARGAFAGRTRWLAPSPPAVADLTAKLRQGAPPDELTGALARDPSTVRADGLTARAGAITEAAGADKALYAALRPLVSQAAYDAWTSRVWNSGKSPFFPKKTGKETYSGELVFLPMANGEPTGEALLMHCALIARARGVAGFVLFPNRQRLDTAIVRFGNSGDPGIPEGAMLDAKTIIAALGGEFPEPKR